ncbi:MAG: NCS2 family permease [Alphaproteobacteria bacterium]|nr:NCS2 family permease [Alphaproteobacteria bacterium]MBV9541695.1 NCS2 family permease [Alphaproteobacteria bacterium]MBV9903464.1 NCS2 family permease [Alphaproteobacteria bacterium]
MFERLFGLSAHATTARREIVAGATTFLTMAYIMFVNPQILKAAGMDPGAVFVATCLASALTTLVMGLYANLPVALAPGMGLNAYFAFAVVPALGGNWRLALGCVFLSGILFVIVSVTPAREWLINAIPRSLKLAIAAGIGFFLALIGLEGAGVVVDSPATLVTQGALTDPKVLIAAGAFVLMFALTARRVIGAVLIAIVAAAIAAIVLKLSPMPGAAVSMPPSIAPTLVQMSFSGAATGTIAVAVFSFLLIDMLDTSGTLTAVAHQAKLLETDGGLKNARRALMTDAVGTMIGAVLGTSPVTAYIESASGVQAGGRTGMTAVVVAVLFLLALFLAPLAGAVPAFATAPALVFVAALMAKGLKDIDWDDVTEAAPALVTALAIPFTYSIAGGIGIGFITYAAIKIVSGRWRDVNAAVAIIAAAFVVKIALE